MTKKKIDELYRHITTCINLTNKIKADLEKKPNYDWINLKSLLYSIKQFLYSESNLLKEEGCKEKQEK